jgi:hypothetical protein
MSKEILGGDVETQFIYRPSNTGIGPALDAVRAEQEAMCGYQLMLKKQRTIEMADAEGKYVEVFVTFMPYPPTAEGHLPPDPGPNPPEPVIPAHLLPPRI